MRFQAAGVRHRMALPSGVPLRSILATCIVVTSVTNAMHGGPAAPKSDA